MRILITSGGTKVPVDPVRSITNTSTGNFGAAIARAALLAGAEVTYLVAAGAKTPFCETFDYSVSTDLEENLQKLKELFEFGHLFTKRYTEHHYTDFAEYSEKLKEIVIEEKPDVVVLAAAVSDYLINNYVANKVRSSDHLQLQFQPAPKLINYVKQWLPTTLLVGFKLLVDAPESELVAAATRSMLANDADIIVANNLTSLQRGAHEILIVERNGAFAKVTHHLADAIINRIMRRSE